MQEREFLRFGFAISRNGARMTIAYLLDAYQLSKLVRTFIKEVVKLGCT